MKIAVLGSNRSWYLQDLQRAAEDRHWIQSFPFTRLRATVDSQAHDVFSATSEAGVCSLSDFDATFVRSMPAGSLEQVVFRMNALANHESNGGLVVNSARSLEISIDKYLALVKLQLAGFDVPRTFVCQNQEDWLESMSELGNSAVIKPVFGGEGRGVERISLDAAGRQKSLDVIAAGGILYVQEYIEHKGSDFRLFVAGDRVLGMQRENKHDWRTNISLGGTAKPLKMSSLLEGLALKAAESVGTTICAIDLLPAENGRLVALEVNAVPGWKALSETTGNDVAKLVLEHLDSLSKSVAS